MVTSFQGQSDSQAHLKELDMRLTTKGRFAVTAMIDLGLRQNNGPVTLAAISQRQQISLSYLEQLFGKLRRHELVESTRGPGGGYTLGRKASEITVADIIVSVDEPIDATQCGGKENCLGDGSRCMTHDLWSSLNSRMVEFLDSVSLQKLVDEQLAKGVVVESTPQVKKAIFASPIVKPMRVNAPNSVFALGNAFSKS
jgi:Rrf2 family iron-sulfur cluster assembly transcriptional regulator